MHSEAGLTYLRAAAVKLEPEEKEDFDMMMLMMMLMLMLNIEPKHDEHAADAVEPDDEHGD